MQYLKKGIRLIDGDINLKRERGYVTYRPAHPSHYKIQYQISHSHPLRNSQIQDQISHPYKLLSSRLNFSVIPLK